MSRSRSDSLLLPLEPAKPDFASERKWMRSGVEFVAGIDEAGRGPLAGPVVAAAVILNPKKIPEGLDDSKRLTAARREELFETITATALACCVASISAPAIDATDILKAALEAMRRAARGLAILPGHILIDGRDVAPGLPCPATALIKGDQRSVSIAAASILAKVTRDRMMAQTGRYYPLYGLEQHAGYATEMHRNAMEQHGPLTGLHRFSFSPLKDRIA
ncbi:ribonuclease HII [Phyllobacterium sp. 0TCS1.6C]|uniref:ribonuclease HII n=1 Tax=unclassified Phyllobacterium TaxID=2638441 RepID=UPI0022641D24|nr:MULTISPECIES: ribonuclease HII [unclassified Phyllobacterium]MCX8281440.1 ribonuclease HII [Phyllobacterium sp. 0TCS1.6C]MCX8295904.1 ribonuclease HII [Phyllobacterium sp. 0TCS1.6A]